MKTAVVVEIHSEASKRVVIEREPDSKAVVIESFQGSPGKSTYELAVKNGFLGSEATVATVQAGLTAQGLTPAVVSGVAKESSVQTAIAIAASS